MPVPLNWNDLTLAEWSDLTLDGWSSLPLGGQASRLRLAQLFDVDGFVPSKASIFLKRVGSNSGTYFDVTDPTTIDACNFASVTQSANKVVIDDRASGFTGSGYMRSQKLSATGDWATLNYPVKTSKPGKYYLNLRTNTDTFVADVLIDGKVVTGLGFLIVGSGWAWNQLSFVLPDDQPHVLSIKMKGDGYLLDKVYIDTDATAPTGTGPGNSVSPFVTLHLQVYQAVSDTPTVPLFVYAYKTTLDEVIIDDWYNFEIRPLDGNTTPLAGRYALVVSSSGSRRSNFVIWELVDNDEYLMLPSALKVNDA